jgi:hypothetical protein
MSNHRLVTAVLMAILVLVSACGQTTIKATPLNNTPPTVVDPYANVSCGENAYNNAGTCMCAGGFKKCGDKCIAQRLCCSNSECLSADKVCTNGVCVDRPICAYNQVWDLGFKECLCKEGTKFCQAQGKCIDEKSCCDYMDCRFGQERCAATTYSASVCMSAGMRKCRVVNEGVPTQFAIPAGEFTVLLQNVFEGPVFDLKVNNDSLRRLHINESNKIANGSINLYVESMEIFGGYCRQEPD